MQTILSILSIRVGKIIKSVIFMKSHILIINNDSGEKPVAFMLLYRFYTGYTNDEL